MASAGGGIFDEVPVFHAENLSSNVKSINYSRTFLSIISGVVAGICGFTGLKGFVFYFLVMMVASLGILVKAKFSVHTYFDSWNRIIIEGVMGGLMSYGPFPPNCMVATASILTPMIYSIAPIIYHLKSFVLFWTFSYDIVHIF